MTSTLLEVADVTGGYRDAPILRNVTLRVDRGEVVALLGPNGAGKTTSLLTIAGQLRVAGGTLRFKGEDIRKTPAHVLARRGIAMVGDDRSLLASLTVAESLRLVRKPVTDPFEFLPELRELRNRRCGLLSGGEQQMLAIARAVSGGPDLLIIDELSQGLAPLVVRRLLEVVRQVADSTGVGVLVVEQHARKILQVADRGCVLVKGRVVLDEPAPVLLEDLHVIEAKYLGQTT
jgi:branched-chain amino acid transport system ATP-binding protein